MPNVSQAQQAFFAMSKSPSGRAKLKASGRKPVKLAVVNEFLKADRGIHGLPKHVHNGKAVK